MDRVKILLDSCSFLWLALNSDGLSKLAVDVINDPSNQLFLSDVSVWEICLKNTAGKLPLPLPASEWVPSRCSFFQLAPVPIRSSAIFLTTKLPEVHTDPFDRLIAAQSIEGDFTILSPDVPLSLLGARRIW